MGHAWLTDVLLPTTKIQKLSGTNEAGRNNRLLGQTCDALAHYSLLVTGGSLVLVDIQGALSGALYLCLLILFIGITVRNSGDSHIAPGFVLMDLMTHT